MNDMLFKNKISIKNYIKFLMSYLWSDNLLYTMI